MPRKLLFALWLLLMPGALFAAEPQKPVLQIQIPGFEGFSNMTKNAADQTSYLVPYLGEYIGALYRYAVFAGSLIAAFLITVGGFQWAASGGDAGRIKMAKARVTNAVTGLLLLIMSYVFLFVINPEFVELKSLSVLSVQTAVVNEPHEMSSETTQTGSPTKPTITPATGAEDYSQVSIICYRVKKNLQPTCVDWCALHPNQSSWPTTNKTSINPDLVQVIPQDSGLGTSGSRSATPELITQLQKAELVMRATLSNDYKLYVTSAFRNLTGQIQQACSKLTDLENGKVAQPGSSNHGSGKAVDIALMKGGTKLNCTDSSCNQNAEDPVVAKQLLDIMTAVGFRRLKCELWHFEYGVGVTAETCATDCPLPPNIPKCG